MMKLGRELTPQERESLRKFERAMREEVVPQIVENQREQVRLRKKLDGIPLF